MLNNIFEQCEQQNIVQYCFYQHREQNMITCSRLTKTGSNNIAELESGVTMLNNIFEQCGQQNIVQYCFYQHREQNMITCSR